jgi:hypothetical protein
MKEHHTGGAYPSGSSASSSPGDGKYDQGPRETSRGSEEFLSERTYVPPSPQTIRSTEHPGYESNAWGATGTKRTPSLCSCLGSVADCSPVGFSRAPVGASIAMSGTKDGLIPAHLTA